MMPISQLIGYVVREDGPCPFCQYPAETDKKKPLLSAKDALIHLEHFRDKKQEFFISLSLDVKQRLIARRVVFIGSLTASIVHPREVFVGPLGDRACSIVIAHNHPSGEVAPSNADIKLTQQLVAAGQIMGIPLDDHVIIAKDGYFSFKANGLMI